MTETDTLGRALFYAGDYEAALVEADSLTAEGNTEDDQVTGWLSKARIYFDLVRYGDSLASLRAIGGKLDGAPAKSKARFYGSRAAVYVKQGEDDKALIDYESGRFWAIESGDKLCEACIRNNLARMYSKADRFVDAMTEVHTAIETAETLNTQSWLGRFTDQKAQILLDHKRNEEALTASRKAVGILELHGNEVTLAEARVTHGRAWIALGVSGLNPAASFQARRNVAEELNPTLDKELIQLALENSGGHVSRAADLLGISHVAMIKAVQKFQLDRHPKRRRAKTLPTR